MRFLPLFFALLPVLAAERFVPVPAGDRVEAFEIAATPVTNAEYALFVTATKHAPPLHWVGGAPPAGMANHPVIFVNRYDVAAYLAWRTKKEGRVYRLPTSPEFDYAARAGKAKIRFPWGDEPPAGKANFDEKGDRTFAQWKQYLKPVASYAPNGWGLYDMVGNVWQMIQSDHDPAIARYKYRIEAPAELEQGLRGGSWARTESYLRIGAGGGASPGLRYPDMGFRLVRAPAGDRTFERQARRVVALKPRQGGGVFLSWQLLAGETAGFHVYRSTRRDLPGERITPQAVTATTSFVDPAAPAQTRLYYRVRPVLADGKEGPTSEWAAYDPDSFAQLAMKIEVSAKEGGFVPVFGDLNGDGVLDAVLRLDHGIREMSRDPGVPVELEGYTNYGRSLWRRKMIGHADCFGSANNAPFVVWDMDGDGKAEVIGRVEEEGKVWLAILDGMNGRTLRRTPWRAMLTDFAKSSTRIHMAIAYLDGKTPAIVTQTGLYENEIIDAYDAKLTKLWEYKSIAETSGSGSHHLDIADLDGDGRDEVVVGTMALNANGTLRWALYRQHPDIVAIKHLIPGRAGRQIYFAVESSTHAGGYVVDASTGKVIWKVNREDDPRWTHAHTGWAADIWEGSPGLELRTNRDGHPDEDRVLFSAEGKILANPFPGGWRPVNWTGGAVRDLLTGNGASIGRYDGKAVNKIEDGPNLGQKANCSMVADLMGDYRDEIVCVSSEVLLVYSNTAAPARREETHTATREYRLWMARNIGGGYGSYFEWQPLTK